jgi:hypothetical protein
MSDDPRGPRGPATEAIEQLAEAVEEQNQQMKVQNAILGVLAMNFERQHRENWELEFGDERKGYSWRRFGTDVSDALFTLEEELDR